MQQSEVVYLKKSKFVFGFALAVLAYHFFTNTFLSQIASPPPPLVFPSIDNTYWLLLISDIPQLVIGSSFLLTVFDISLISLPLLVFVYPSKRLLYILFSVFITLYFLIFNLYSGHHFHGLVGLILISIPFWVKSSARFDMLWKAVRFYTLFIFASAAIWKTTRGTAFDFNHLHNILQHQHAQLLFDNPEGWRASFVRWLLMHPTVCFALMLSAVVSQASFAIGFFTSRFDYVLLALLLLFVVFNYLVMNIVSSELLVLGLTLLPEIFWKNE